MRTGMRGNQEWSKAIIWSLALAFVSLAGVPLAGAGGAAQPQEVNPAAEPIVPERSSLPSLASARGSADKCDVLLKWLETGKAAAAPSRYPAMIPPEEMGIFRDGPMLAVFGKRYDDLDNHERIDLMEKVFARCTGEARPAPRQTAPRPGIRFGGVDLGRFGANAAGNEQPLPREYMEEFRPWAELLHEAFGGRPGRFEPVAITHYLGQIRQQIAWLNSILGSSPAAPTVESCQQLEDAAGQIDRQASLLSPEERAAARRALEGREQELAPGVVHAWLANAEKDGKSVESAQQLEQGHRQLSGVIARLNADQKNAAEQQYNRLLDGDIAAALQTDTARLRSIPASWQGLQQLAQLEADFQRKFGAFASSASFQNAAEEIARQRERILPAALPAWQRKVAATPAESADIAARRQELQEIFPTASDRQSPLFARFEKPVAGREEEMQARAAAEERRQQQARIAAEQKAMSQVASVQLPRASGPADHSGDQEGEGAVLVFPVMIKALYAGNISVIPDDQLFRSYFLSLSKGITDACPDSGTLDEMSAVQYGSPMFEAGSPSPVEQGLQLLKNQFQMYAEMAQASNTGGMVDAVRNHMPDGGLIREGVMDGETVAKTWKCNTVTNLKIRATLSRLFEQRKDHKPGPSDQQRFYALMNPEYRQLLQSSGSGN